MNMNLCLYGRKRRVEGEEGTSGYLGNRTVHPEPCKQGEAPTSPSLTGFVSRRLILRACPQPRAERGALHTATITSSSFETAAGWPSTES